MSILRILCFFLGSGPSMKSCSPTLIGPEVKNGLYVLFHCKVVLTNNNNARIKVTFLFDGEAYTDVPDIVLTPPENKATLHEKYLYGKLGKRVSTVIE